MIPPFPIEGGVGLAAARAASVIGLMGAFGGVLYPAWLAPGGLSERTRARLDWAAWGGLAAAILGAVLWLVVETADLAETVSAADVAAVLGQTQFGHLLAWRLGLLVLAAVAFAGRRAGVAACLAGGALALQAGHSHAQAMYGPGLLLLSSGLHLLAAGAWLGSLVPLMIVCAGEPAAMAAQAARRFSPLGIACVSVLAITATAQSLAWIEDLPGLIGTAYGWIAGLKMALFASLVLLSARNRAGSRGAGFDAVGQRALLVSIAAETALGVAVVFAAGVLSELPPAMHVQKLWPFAWAPSLDAAREDPEYRGEALRAAIAMAAAALVLAAGCIRLRGGRRLVVVGASVAAMLVCLPHFGPLFVPAVPTRYFRAPRAPMADAAPLYRTHCAGCHGAEGRGDGPAGRALRIPPANLMAPHLFMHSDGELFWWITHGIVAPDGSQAMPGFPALTEDETWALIGFIRARNPNGGKAVEMDGMKM